VMLLAPAPRGSRSSKLTQANSTQLHCFRAQSDRNTSTPPPASSGQRVPASSHSATLVRVHDLHDQRRATVVVVGAGVIGLAVALQLRRAGISNVLVVDREQTPGMGSTSRANGGVRAQFTTPINIEFSRFTTKGLVELHGSSASQVGFRPIGYLFLTGTSAGVIALRRAFELQQSLGVAVEWLSPARALEIAPSVRETGLRAATFASGDGVVDPHGVVSALWLEGREAGVSYLLDSDVVGIVHDAARTTVLSTRADVETEYVVNAAGPQARHVAALAGIDLPVTNFRRNLACTESIGGLPDPMPMCVDVDTGVLIRREAEGVLIGFSDPDDAPSEATSFDPRFLEAIATRVGNRFPFLEHVPINPRKCWAGLYPETPDHHAIIDAPPDAPWFIQCVGFGGHGIMHSMAAGQAVAELIRDQRCSTFDLRPLRLNRFGDPTLIAETAVL
jgi:sarcosine oxidase subunit beta